MTIKSVSQAIDRLNDVREAAGIREAAIRYLADHSTPTAIARLTQALQDDDVGVRWEAANALAQLGDPAILEVLKALIDPQRVGDPRLRESAYHLFRVTQPEMPVSTAELLEALKGPAADVASLVAAHRVLGELKKHQSQKTLAGRSVTTAVKPPSVPGNEYGSAQLTGRLSRLNGHHID